jgi:glycerol-3-phosphate dehydrogenase
MHTHATAEGHGKDRELADETCDVLIIGSGMNGTALAAALGIKFC